MILVADSEGHDQTARMRSLILAFAVRICPKTRLRKARPIESSLSRHGKLWCFVDEISENISH